MLTPIFVALRWDATIVWPWVVCFVPLFSLHMLFCVPVVLIVPSPPDDMGPEEQSEWDDAMVEIRKTRFLAGMIMMLLILLEVFVALRLDGTVGWSWYIV